MQFVIIGMDGTDDDAPMRRSSARARHLEGIERLKENGNALFGAAILDEDGVMRGSMLVVEFADRRGLEEYLAREPYMTDNVWQSVDVKPCLVPDMFRVTRR
ncbi:MAG TPA: YciI family protein [Deltaproteobacteria bacterium]|nr:YciI family protein [Deltaproteobacteria bacterium]